MDNDEYMYVGQRLDTIEEFDDSRELDMDMVVSKTLLGAKDAIVTRFLDSEIADMSRSEFRTAARRTWVDLEEISTCDLRAVHSVRFTVMKIKLEDY